MKKLFSTCLFLVTFSSFATSYQCEMTFQENIKVIRVKVTEQAYQDEVDVSDYANLDIKYIVDQDVINPEGMGLEYFTQGITGENNYVLYTADYTHPSVKFSFDDDPTLAECTDRSDECRLKIKDENGNEMNGLYTDVTPLDRTDIGSSSKLSTYGFVEFSQKTKKIRTLFWLHRSQGLKNQDFHAATSYIYNPEKAPADFNFKTILNTGFHDADNLIDLSKGYGKDDQLEVSCLKI